jgi:hypothetical protein
MLSDAGMRCRESKLVNPNRPLSHWLAEAAYTRGLQSLIISGNRTKNPKPKPERRE